MKGSLSPTKYALHTFKRSQSLVLPLYYLFFVFCFPEAGAVVYYLIILFSKLTTIKILVLASPGLKEILRQAFRVFCLRKYFEVPMGETLRNPTCGVLLEKV